MVPLLVAPDVWLAAGVVVTTDGAEDDRVEEGDGLCDMADEPWRLLG